MTPLRSLIAKGGTRTFTKAEVEAERPTISELRLEALEAIQRGDYGRAVTLQRCVFRRLEEARQGESIEG